MLGIKFQPAEEERFERYARDCRRPKSALAREWILERLDRESIDAEVGRAAAIIATHTTAEELVEHERDTEEHLRLLDEEDGGFDWGAAGPPV